MLAEVKGGGWDPADWSPDDKQLLVLEGISINESYLWLFDTQTGAKKEITPRPRRGRGKGCLLSGAVFQGRQRHFCHDRSRIRIPAAGLHRPRQRQAHLSVPDAKWDVDNWDLSHDGKQIAYTLNENGVSTLHLIESCRATEP